MMHNAEKKSSRPYLTREYIVGEGVHVLKVQVLNAEPAEAAEIHLRKARILF